MHCERSLSEKSRSKRTLLVIAPEQPRSPRRRTAETRQVNRTLRTERAYRVGIVTLFQKQLTLNLEIRAHKFFVASIHFDQKGEGL
jgi:hypothetical protein